MRLASFVTTSSFGCIARVLCGRVGTADTGIHTRGEPGFHTFGEPGFHTFGEPGFHTFGEPGFHSRDHSDGYSHCDACWYTIGDPGAFRHGQVTFRFSQVDGQGRCSG